MHILADVPRGRSTVATMPWNAYRYPPAMQNLPEIVRLKAIEIANALLESGHDEGQSIRIAIATAKRWAGMTPDDTDRP